MVEQNQTRRIWLPAIILLVLSPCCAEYLAGYDTSTGRPGQLLAGLLVFIPLYGCPALLIREVTVRAGVGWLGRLLVACAFGVLQAGVIDQSLFNTAYRNIDYWDALIGPTRIEPLGVSVYTILLFVGGHIAWSYGGPIAVAEALSPATAARAWMRRFDLVPVAVFYLFAGWLVMEDHLTNEKDHASASQVVSALAAAAILAGVGMTLKAKAAALASRTAPPPVAALLVGLAAGGLAEFFSPTWRGVLGVLKVVLVCAALFVWWSRSRGWGVVHCGAVGVGVLLAHALFGFAADPLGDVPVLAKYSHNAACVAVLGLIGWWVVTRKPPHEPAAIPAEPIAAADGGA